MFKFPLFSFGLEPARLWTKQVNIFEMNSYFVKTTTLTAIVLIVAQAGQKKLMTALTYYIPGACLMDISFVKLAN